MGSRPRILGNRWFVPVAIGLVSWALTTHGKYSVSGDEPHYLVIAQSMLEDGDLDLRNNYGTQPDRLIGPVDFPADLHAREARTGELVSVHDVGTPLALLPVYAAATRIAVHVPPRWLRPFRLTQGLLAYSIISLIVIAITCAAAMLTRAALVADGLDERISSIAVLVVWLSPPVLSNSFLVFPEPFALLATGWTLNVATAPAPRPRSILTLALALGLLPWFHRKFLVYAATLFLVAGWRMRSAIWRLPQSRRAALLGFFAAPQLAYVTWTWHYWGNIGGPLMLDRAPFAWDAFRAGWLGLIVDRENGLLVWAPIFLLLPAAWALSWRRNGPWLLPVAALYLLSAAHDLWWGGFAPAARFLVPLAPIFAFVGVVLVRHARLRAACVALLLPQLLVSAYGWQHTRALWPQGNGQNQVAGEILSWFGISESWLPSLRASPPDIGRAIATMIGVATANIAAWLTTLGRRPAS